jgi:AcrR family transcriptional regulator
LALPRSRGPAHSRSLPEELVVPVETLAISRSEILEVARRALARDGAVSLGRIARELGTDLSSLYEHFTSEQELLTHLAADALVEQAFELESADSDLLAQAWAYRRFALERPQQYRLITECPLPSESLSDGLRAHPPRAFLDQLGPDLARAAWAFVHGMVELELDGRFRPDTDLDTAWRAGVAAFTAAAASTTNSASRHDPNP